MLIKNLLVGMGAALVAGSAMAQEAGVSGNGLVAIGAGLAIGLAAVGGTLGQGMAAGKALEGLARNPGSKDQVFTPFILALALIESQALLGFVIAFMLQGKV